MKKYLLIITCYFSIIFNIHAKANCKKVYTIGAYDEGFAKKALVTKLGPIPANKISPNIPPSFLEKNGSYGGGEAFCTINAAREALQKQLKSGILPKNIDWHIYLLEANWQRDVYKLHDNDFRIRHAVKVLQKVSD